jgi:hypothetical protein
MKLLKVIPINEDGSTDENVQYECWHPLGILSLKKETTPVVKQPYFCAVDYDYGSVLDSILDALGWQGGTLHQALDEIRRLKKEDK